MNFYFQSPMARMMRQKMWMHHAFGNDEGEVYFPIDIRDEGEAYVITAPLPGIKSEDLNIEITEYTVRLRGEMPEEKLEGKEYILRERPSGRFSRSVELPSALDAETAEANLENGILTLRIPKAEQARPKVIKVNAK
jgi:HSP20 family protein